MERTLIEQLENTISECKKWEGVFQNGLDHFRIRAIEQADWDDQAQVSDALYIYMVEKSETEEKRREAERESWPEKLRDKKKNKRRRERPKCLSKNWC